MKFKVLERFTVYSFYCIDCHWCWMKKENKVTRCVRCNSKNTVGPPKQRAPVEMRVLSQLRVCLSVGCAGMAAMNMLGRTGLSI